MRAGKHYVSFQVNDDAPKQNLGVTLGIMRPTTKDITTVKGCHPGSDDLSMFSLKNYEMLHCNNIDCCLMNTYFGTGYIRKRWKEREEGELMDMDEEQRLQDWEGMEPTDDRSFKIGMVLDLDEGTLDVVKNDRRLGTLKNGLSGEYCWVITKPSGSVGLSVSIGR